MVLKLLCTYGNQLNNLWKEFYILEENKKCTKCGEIKPVSEFYWYKTRKHYFSVCKKCSDKYSIQWQKNNREKCSEYSKTWNRKNITSRKKYQRENKDIYKKAWKKWAEKNPEKRRKITLRAQRKRRLIPKNRINKNISNAILRTLKGIKNKTPWETIVGYTLEDLINHLEKQFAKGMNWNNHGNKGWHIDHIIPISLWQYESYNDREFKQCWSLANLQPLWAKDNMSKGNKV